ncbi:hypothetical protein CPK_ORF00934 [Chlamydia pneumoniae LPCoLN]|uniref:Uncharacterized protein n=1 Tax=Chlamydia pneumoniae TaxID=83558 RepID=A0A0F7WVP6_CHLPN|nr:hypothetical protein CPK_ORF00934 [Chlamydia pneumoniae LPCoLN]CRI36917.1 Uncharacterized protein BN1224_CV14_A_04360 [Chlamydia pneumoniae]CRI42538.1 Uncharacterized protein BN1224_DC9_BS_00210 [Chlamydia pneumoniae]CRI43661.1 Uncharacterized protein BN1224_H12_DY_00090 [Chlamydia pneumoniae]CRI45902.1 Uncharacterized protein BN1224_MUL2216_E_01630 [Chlamydia pneumoniae]
MVSLGNKEPQIQEKIIMKFCNKNGKRTKEIRSSSITKYVFYRRKN